MKHHKAITFTSKQLHGDAGAWFLRVDVDGRQIKRKLTDPKLMTKDDARERAREIVRDARAGRWEEINATKTRRGIATVGEILAAYISSESVEVLPKVKANNARNLRLVIRQGLAHLGRPVNDPDKLSAEVLTWELADAFKAWRKANAVPQTGTIDPRLPDDEPIAGKLEGDDLQRMKRSANTVLRTAKHIFSKNAVSAAAPEQGAYAALTLPDVSGFLAVREFKTNKAGNYVAPKDESVTAITDAMAELKAGTLSNADLFQTTPKGTLIRRKRSRFWVAKWRREAGKWRIKSTKTENRAEAQALADEWAAAEGYDHHDGRLGEPGGFFIHNAPGSPRGRGRRINQRRAYVAMCLALELGLRAEEIAEARWSQVKRINGELIFHATSTESYKGTKGLVDREIPFPEDLFEELHAMLEDSRFMIGGSPSYRKLTLPKEVAGVMRSTGWRRVECLHELRKVYASDYGHEVKDPTIVRDVLGHKSLTTTMRYLGRTKMPPKKSSRRVKVAA
jgi:integrase